MAQKHKHYDVIVAFAEGKQIQVKLEGNVWADAPSPRFSESSEYRVKPATLKYRVALFSGYTNESPWTAVAHSEVVAHKFENFGTFVRWITDWQEVEV